MSNRLSVYCVNLNRYVNIAGGETPMDIYRRYSNEIPFVPVVARINFKSGGPELPFFAPKILEFVT